MNEKKIIKSKDLVSEEYIKDSFWFNNNLLDEVYIGYQVEKKYSDGTSKLIQNEITLNDLLKCYYENRNKSRKQNLILQQVNKYRANYKKQLDNFRRIEDYYENKKHTSI